MKIIGITGKSGSGKTTFSTLLSQKLNCLHVDADKVCHNALLQPEIKNKLCNKFGLQILDVNGNIDRKKVGNIVFCDNKKMKFLTNLTWNFFIETVDELLLQDNKYIILDAILLPHIKYWDMCTLKILIESDNSLRKNMVIKRDNISENYLDKRESSDVDYSSCNFDYIFKNNYNYQTMEQAINELVKIV